MYRSGFTDTSGAVYPILHPGWVSIAAIHASRESVLVPRVCGARVRGGDVSTRMGIMVPKITIDKTAPQPILPYDAT